MIHYSVSDRSSLRVTSNWQAVLDVNVKHILLIGSLRIMLFVRVPSKYTVVVIGLNVLPLS